MERKERTLLKGCSVDRESLTPEQRQAFNMFTQSKRVIGVLQRAGKPIPPELARTRVVTDYYLTQTTEGWQSHSGFTKGQLVDEDTIADRVGEIFTSDHPK